MRLAVFAAILVLSAAPVRAQEVVPDPATSAIMPSDPAAPPQKANPVMTGPQILISTAMGDITLQLDSVRAPKSVPHIVRYVRAKHYDGTVVYRVAQGFVIQMGSFEAGGKGRGIRPGPLPLEANNGLSNLRGTVALARAEEPDSATAEFFINLADNSFALDQKIGDPANSTGYAVFGQVIAGMDVVDAIAAVPVGDDGPMPGQAPVTPILIKKVTVIAPPKLPK